MPLTESSSSRPLFGLSLWAVLIPLPVFAGMTMLLGVFALKRRIFPCIQWAPSPLLCLYSS